MRVLSRAPCEPRNHTDLDLRSRAVRPGCARGDSGCEVSDHTALAASRRDSSTRHLAHEGERAQRLACRQAQLAHILKPGSPGQKLLTLLLTLWRTTTV